MGAALAKLWGVMYAMLGKYWRRSKSVKSSEKKKNNANECEFSKRRWRSSRVSRVCVSVTVSAEEMLLKRGGRRGEVLQPDACGFLTVDVVWISENCKQSSQ